MVATAALVSVLDGMFAGPARYYPAYFRQVPSSAAVLEVFPTEGPKIVVPLVGDLPGDFRPITFGSDGRTLYGQRNDPNADEGITKIEFQPPEEVIGCGVGGVSYDLVRIGARVIRKTCGLRLVEGARTGRVRDVWHRPENRAVGSHSDWDIPQLRRSRR